MTTAAIRDQVLPEFERVPEQRENSEGIQQHKLEVNFEIRKHLTHMLSGHTLLAR